jgi:hypothetical protein
MKTVYLLWRRIHYECDFVLSAHSSWNGAMIALMKASDGFKWDPVKDGFYNSDYDRIDIEEREVEE